MFNRSAFLAKLTAIITIAILIVGIFPSTVLASEATVTTNNRVTDSGITSTSTIVSGHWAPNINISHIHVEVEELGVILGTSLQDVQQVTINNFHNADHRASDSADQNPFTVNIRNLRPNTTYYVRAYAIIRFGLAQSQVFLAPDTSYASFTTRPDNIYASLLFQVHTDTVTFTNGIISARGTFPEHSLNFSNVTERGFIVSPTFSMQTNATHIRSRPSLETNQHNIAAEWAADPNATALYVRAYVRINNGHPVHGIPKRVELTPDPTPVVLTRSVEMTSNRQAHVTIDVTQSGQSQVLERGIVFSDTVQSPQRSQSNVRQSVVQGGVGEIDITIDNLQPNTRYFVRAFARNHQGTSYGQVVELQTTPPNVELTINFLTVGSEANAGTQLISTTQGSELTASQLQVPTGFSLSQPQWSINVTNQMTYVSVLVQPDVVPETAFVPDTGNFTFSPNRATTRAEVAQIIYNLSTTPSTGTPIAFADVPVNHPNHQAIDFVSSRLYMRGDAGANTFRPNDPISRAEITAVLTNFYSLSGTATSNFPDIAPTAWYFLPVSLAFANNMVTGYEDGTFGPHLNITRAEVTTIFVRGEQRSEQPLSNLAFTDVPTNHWAHRFIMNASIPQN